MASGGLREAALLFFVMFCAGLAALTVFPANFWTLYHWQEAFQGREPFFPLTPLSQSVAVHRWRPYFSSQLCWGQLEFLYGGGKHPDLFADGLFPNLLWRPRWWKGLLAGFCASFSIEFLQLFVNRSTDVDDLDPEHTGGLCGGLIALLLRRLAPRFTQHFQVEVQHGRETGDRGPAPGAGAGQL